MNVAGVPKWNDDYFNNVYYEYIAGLLRQRKSRLTAPTTINANSINANANSFRKRLTPVELAKKNANSQCRKCKVGTLGC